MNIFFFLLVLCTMNAAAQREARSWLTTPDRGSLLKEQPPVGFMQAPDGAGLPVIRVYPDSTRQQMDGFGFALTGGSAQHLMHMSASGRARLLQELFGRGGKPIGISYLRLSIGASDLNDHVFSYDDLPQGQSDTSLRRFDLASDKDDVIPILKQVLKINPHIKLMASPWSAPVWMKTNNNIRGGKLKEGCYAVYARYLLKYIQSMQANGIVIDALTVQNEPFNDGNTPSMQMFAKEQARFIRDYLGPAFKKNGIRTKIILYDHNCDAPEYPISILTDASARRYIDGSGFHLYAGSITALTKVHDAFPKKNLYFTEMMAVNRNEFNIAAPVARILIGATRNWSRNVILWNLAANSRNEPHTDNGGCSICQGAVTIDGDAVQRNLAYYVIAHASGFVPPHSFRVFSNDTDQISNVAFQTPEGQTVLIAANRTDNRQEFLVQYKEKGFRYSLDRGAVVTLVW